METIIIFWLASINFVLCFVLSSYRSMAAATFEVIWLEGLLVELGASVSRHVTLYCDRKGAIQIASNPIYHERTKHIEIDCYFVREKIKEGLTQTEHIGTKEQLADL